MNFSKEEIKAVEEALQKRCKVPDGDAAALAVVALEALADNWRKCFPTSAATEAMSEAGVQDRVRLRGAKLGWELWRNNKGVATDSRGVPVRFGLANDSKKLGDKIKSADLIGIRPVQITQAMVGCKIGQFVSLEIKAPGWRFHGGQHEEAQMRWAAIVNATGGYATFITSEEQVR